MYQALFFFPLEPKKQRSKKKKKNAGSQVRGREARDLGTASMGRGDVWDGDAEDVNEYCKSLR